MRTTIDQETIQSPIPSILQRVVEIKSVTWNKESHGLFDYENNFYEMKKFQLQCSADMIRTDNNIICSKRDGKKISPQRLNFILSIEKKESDKDEYFIRTPSNLQDPSLQSFLIIRALKNRDGRSQRGYRLKMNDLIRFGRVEFRVSELQLDYDPKIV